MKLNNYLLVSFLILFIFQIPSFSQNTSSRLKYLSKNADAIVTGKVIQTKSHWNENKSRIYTTATIEVEEYLKGESPNRKVEILFPGGEIDGVGELYTHVPTLNNNEEVLLFIKKQNEKAQFTILEGDLGKYSLRTDIRSGEKLTSDNKKLSAYKNEIKKVLVQD